MCIFITQLYHFSYYRLTSTVMANTQPNPTMSTKPNATDLTDIAFSCLINVCLVAVDLICVFRNVTILIRKKNTRDRTTYEISSVHTKQKSTTCNSETLGKLTQTDWNRTRALRWMVCAGAATCSTVRSEKGLIDSDLRGDQEPPL